MPDTQWEKIIDKMVERNTRLIWAIYDDEAQSPWTLAGDILVPNHDYRLHLSVKNTGSEVHFDKLQVRVVPKEGHVTFYAPDYLNPKPRIDHTFEDVRPNLIVNLGAYMRVNQQIRDKPLFSIGVYGTVRPQGHSWDSNLVWPDDKYKDVIESNPFPAFW